MKGSINVYQVTLIASSSSLASKDQQQLPPSYQDSSICRSRAVVENSVEVHSVHIDVSL